MVIIWLHPSPGWHWAAGNKLLHFSRALRPPALLHSRWLRVEACFTFTIMNHYKLFLVFCCTSCRIVGFCHKYIPCLHGNSFNSPDTVSIIPLWLLWPERRENNVQRILITQRLIQTKEGASDLKAVYSSSQSSLTSSSGGTHSRSLRPSKEEAGSNTHQLFTSTSYSGNFTTMPINDCYKYDSDNVYLQ